MFALTQCTYQTPPPTHFTYPTQPTMNSYFPTQTSYNEFRYIETKVQEIQEDTPEEVPAQRKKSGKGREPARPWSTEEEIALAKGWMDIPEDLVTGNSKKRESYWQRMTDYFHNEMGRGIYRSHHQINSKWKDLTRKVTAFSGILNNLTAQRKSDQSNADIMKLAHQQYRATNKGSAFVHEHVLEMVEKSPKWVLVPPMVPSMVITKKSKTSESNTYTTSSDTQGPFHLDDDDDFFEEPQRPSGSRKSKRSSSSSSLFVPDDSTATVEDFFGRLMDSLKEFKDINIDKNERKQRKEQQRQELIEIKKEKNRLLQEQQRKKDLRTLMKPHDHLTGTDLELVLQLKAEIRKQYGLE